MSRGKKATTATLSTRLPDSFAERVKLQAAVKHLSTSSYIADALHGRDRTEYPLLMALGRLVAIEQQVLTSARIAPDDLRHLETIVRELCAGAWAEITQ